MKIRARRLHGERGSAIIEMTVVTPLLLLLVLGIARFGIAFNNYLVLTDAVRWGARELATSRGTTNPCQSAGNVTRAAATSLNLATLSLSTRPRTSGSTYSATGSSPTCSSEGTQMSAGDMALVTGTYPCSLVIMGIDFRPSCTLTSQLTVRIE